MDESLHVRSRSIKIIFAAFCLIIFAQLVNLQLLSPELAIAAEDQARYDKVIYPSRGLVFDRHGKIILDNTTLHDLVVIPARLKGIDTGIVLSILHIDKKEFNKRVLTAIIRNGRYRPYSFQSLLDEKSYARLNENLYKIQPGFDLVARPVRKYPYKAAAHLLGYLAEVSPNFLEKHPDEGYRQGDYAGMTGLERSYEKALIGQRGVQRWLRDKLNRPTQRFEQGKYDTVPVSGSNLRATLDIELQQLGEKLMAGKMGSVVAIDPQTGGILAMVSGPSYDPSLLTGAGRRKHFSQLYLDPRLPLYNRAITGTYSPGSTFKTLQALVGMQEGVMTEHTGYACTGRYNGCGNGRPKCHGAGHAPDLEHAIATSCNPYFADAFRKIIDQPRYGSTDSALAIWDNYMHDFGLGKKLGVDLPGEKMGNIPTPAYYRKVFGPAWSSCNILSNAIGQGEVNSTVLQLTNAIAMIANKGWYYTPHVIDSIEGGDTYGLLEPFRKKIQAIDIPDNMFEAVHQGMDDVVQGSGTGRRVKIDGVIMCGKTGTVQNYYKGKAQKDHSFFAAFAPRDNPRIAIACIVENGGFGATVAAPIVSLMVEKYLNDTIGKKHQPWIETYSNMTITPPRIADEIHKRDSVRHAKDSIAGQQKLVEQLKDTTGLEEVPDSSINQSELPAAPEPGKKNHRPVANSKAIINIIDKKPGKAQKESAAG